MNNIYKKNRYKWVKIQKLESNHSQIIPTDMTIDSNDLQLRVTCY